MSAISGYKNLTMAKGRKKNLIIFLKPTKLTKKICTQLQNKYN